MVLDDMQAAPVLAMMLRDMQATLVDVYSAPSAVLMIQSTGALFTGERNQSRSRRGGTDRG